MIISIPRNNSNKFNWLLLLCLFISVIANAQSPEKEKAMSLLKKHGIGSLKQSISDSYRVTDAYQDITTGLFLVYAQQLYQGVPVFNKISVYAFRKDSMAYNKQNIISKLPDVNRTSNYAIGPQQAVQFAAKHLSIPVSQQPQMLRSDIQQKHFVFKMPGSGSDSSAADLVWLPSKDGKDLKLAWNIFMSVHNGDDAWLVQVDAQTGEYISKLSLVINEVSDNECAPLTPAFVQPDFNLNTTSSAAGSGKYFAPPTTTNASYNVYAIPLESPNYGNRSIDNNPWLKAGATDNATTNGWHFDGTTNYNFSRGNNVWAQDDTANLSPVSALLGPIQTGISDISSTALPSLTFNQPLDFTVNPVKPANLRAGIDNLFYWCNIMHDISYQYGFNEQAGNLQADNLGRGGLGNDFVRAYAADGAGKDGSGVYNKNNANYSPLMDGQSPRIRMYLWYLDSSFRLHINNPSAIAGNYYLTLESSINVNNLLKNTGPKTADVILVNDDASGTAHTACSQSFNNTAGVGGKIALIDASDNCSINQQILNVQHAGAISVIIINNAAGLPKGFGTGDPTITIPVIMVSMSDGNILKANLTGLNGTLSTSLPTPRDGSLDNGIVSHEYTHGISTRLTGGPSNIGCLATVVPTEQGGEGWSDYMALMVTTNWATATINDGAKPRPIGTYVKFQRPDGVGIRRYPYSTDMNIDPLTYDDVANTGGEPHRIGESWCATLWDMTWAIIQQEGIDPDIYQGTKGNNIAIQLVITGLKLQPCNPGFLDARDAILKADSLLYSSRHKCIIWNAFARRGMGYSAKQGSSLDWTDQVAAFDPPSLTTFSLSANKTTLANGDNITYTIKTKCECTPLTNISIVDTLQAGLIYQSSSAGGVYQAPVVRFNGLSFAPGDAKTFTITAKVGGPHTTPVMPINDTRDPAIYNWTAAVVSGSTNWVVSTDFSHSPTHSWHAAADQLPTGKMTLTSADIHLPDDTTLVFSFWHLFITDAATSTGLVEISTDGGQNWQDLGPYMVQNSYDISSQLPDPRTGFFGISNPTLGFVQTIIPLRDFKGLTTRIRFSFTSGNSANNLGWYVDDISLSSSPGLANTVYAYNDQALLAKNNVFNLFTASALPVHFISFDAQKQNKSAALHWKVSNEINISKYVVERSADGINFSPIGEVTYNNTSANEKDYYYTDNQPLTGNNYYRVAEKDLDGKSTLSVIKLLSFNTDNNSVRLSPVPTYNHTVQLEIESTNAGSYNAYLVNTVGQVIKTYPVKTGINTVDLQNFANGIYYLKVDLGNGRTELRKLVIE